MVLDLFAALATLTLTLGLMYYVAMLWMGLRESKKGSPEIPDANGDAKFNVFVLVPCLNEELVIGRTVERIIEDDPRAQVIVIDDASEDTTVEVARQAGGPRVHVVQRQLPDARTGKGHALNAGYAEVLRIVGRRRLHADKVLICVMDADGQLSDGAAREVIKLFRRSEVGGVQLPVSIRNRGTLLTNIQDFEFWGMSAVAQLARRQTMSVSLGGNGQFTRLSALMSLGGEPWSESLTEDLDLAIRLELAGWELTSTPRASVSQQGVESLRPLIRQRTRWYQGHMSCAGYVRDLWDNKRLSNKTVLESSMYLLSPYLLALPWSILFNLALYVSWQQLWQTPSFTVFGSEVAARIVTVGGWYLASFLPSIVTGWVYARRVRHTGYLKSFAYGHLLIGFAYITWFACWRALFRMIFRRNDWAKTARSQELAANGPTSNKFGARAAGVRTVS